MKTYIFGAGGHGKVVCDIFQAQGLIVDGFIDSNPRMPNLFGIPVYDESVLAAVTEFQIIVALGANHLRKSIVDRLKNNFPKAIFLNAIHPTASVSNLSQIGVGNVVTAGAIVGPGSTVGNHCVVNTGAQIDHDCVLSDFSTAAPGVVMGGTVKVGVGAYIAIGAVVRHGVSIGEWSVIGAGAVVLGDVPKCVVAYGSPSKVVRSRSENDPYL